MKKTAIILLITAIFMSISLYADTDFVEYYNNRANWEGGVIGNGRLLIKEPVMVNRKLILPETVSVKIITNGKLTIPGHEFSIGGQDPSGSYDPRSIYLKKTVGVLMPILLDDE